MVVDSRPMNFQAHPMMKHLLPLFALTVFITSCSVSPTSPSVATNTVTNIYSYTNYWDPMIRYTTAGSYASSAALADGNGNILIEFNTLTVATTPYQFVTQGTYQILYRFWTNTLPSSTNWISTAWMTNSGTVTLTNQTVYSIKLVSTATNTNDFIQNREGSTNKSVISLVRDGALDSKGDIY